MIITDNENALRVKCESVKPEEIDGLIALLEQELSYSNKMGRLGIGLAAIQCGIFKNAAIVRINEKFKVNLVNCKIANAYDEFVFQEEGCLSFPNRIENTIRFNEVHIVDNDVYPHNFIATGLFAVVIQHELDHLNGILLSDRAIPKIKPKANELCYCGSKLKYKRCHYLKERNV